MDTSTHVHVLVCAGTPGYAGIFQFSPWNGSLSVEKVETSTLVDVPVCARNPGYAGIFQCSSWSGSLLVEKV